MIDSDQNQRRTEDLAAKVSRLKNVTHLCRFIYWKILLELI